MSSMNIRQARVIDPVLTTVVQGYRPAERVGRVLFPSVDVLARGGTVLEFDRESFRRKNAIRAPGAGTIRIAFGYEGKPYALKQEAIDAPVPREIQQDAQVVPGVDLGTRAVIVVMDSLTLGLEYEQAKIATDPANYPVGQKQALAGTDKWNDPDSDPLAMVLDAKETVRKQIGLDPNRMVLPKPGLNALKRHPKITDRFKYTDASSITPDMLAALFDLETLAVGKAQALEGPEGEEQFVDLWGNAAALAYAPMTAEGTEQPSYGYTYTLKGCPFVEEPYWDGSHKSWIYGVTYDRAPVLTGMSAGFLFQNLV